MKNKSMSQHLMNAGQNLSRGENQFGRGVRGNRAQNGPQNYVFFKERGVKFSISFLLVISQANNINKRRATLQ